ncbi:MAG: UDP-glucose 4-epimerase GalE [Peptoniphilaceae bacterium]|uniref:UDP-glucose 4-epimerase GalE n=1 Tax=Parvimonas sp. TaxID=1944660 RepID=UPI0025ED2065|nr:UDP-glucose 4-epimerase GalE [Parvimonas sp.]MCI5997691.1 UDP-glucose 4-epimerase GalE [Parvimonas sp.]MDD7765545.1 UDP-glucose 4-epimerase GalE [Peptoniphilaceae bacterium]MDY3051086.1 UDP-glucose 4-epimerase GalE [Parvimonas sp.]
MKKILVTGGLGYIGSHTCVELLNAGYEVVVIDNLDNSSEKVLGIIEDITSKKIKFYKDDVRNKEGLRKIFSENEIYGVIHFAGLKSVNESVSLPLKYYDNNIYGTIVLTEVMNEFNVKNIIFSSSATVYGKPKTVPIKEDFSLSVTNPYGRSKLFLEEFFNDLYISDNEWNIVLLRYFNPIGAHKSGRIGEDPNGIPNNLIPYVTQVAVGKLDHINVYGNDYETKDGTGVRDYIHVVDLAVGHIKAIQKFDEDKNIRIYNLGTGKGYSVFDIINSFNEVTGKKLKYVISERRKGDIGECYADPSKAKEELGFETKYDINEMCEDSWRWQKNNPNGYGDR